MATKTREIADFLVEGGADIALQGKPHIKPNVLYPAWSGLLTDNTGHTFTDSGSGGHTTTGYGGVHHSGIDKKVGSTSIKFDGQNGQIKTVDHADFDISGQFTLECWIKVNSITNYDGILSFDGTGSADFTLGFGTDSKIYLYSHAGNATAVVNSSDTITVGQWYHVAVSRDGSNNTRFYLNGVHKTVSTSYTAGHTTQSGGLAVGKFYNGADEKFLDGYIDQVRVSNTARYTGTGSFTPSTSAYSSDSNTKFLLQSDNGGHVGVYGTTQADGNKYYYTDFKGNKPIKDPRIGAHFGSQRHTTRSLQLLEQETATHGEKVYSVDGREWMKVYGQARVQNDDQGTSIQLGHDGTAKGHGYIEIVGYFSSLNWSKFTHSSAAYSYVYKIDGGEFSAEQTTFEQSTATPLGNRYVDRGSLAEIVTGQTLGIHTLTLRTNASATDYIQGYAVELIAQDTTSTATKSKIQIPAQTVVSYGKKFALSAAAQHYNPFAQSQTDAAVTINSSTTNTAKLTGGWSGTGATYYSSELDTATSLGLDAWVSGGEYFRPVNGGRVVWWINSSGALKCSVNMMPPAATAPKYGSWTVGQNVPTGVHNWATKYQPAFYSRIIDHSQAEVAKTFDFREFGNGGANHSSNHIDLSSKVYTNSTQDTAYVMDDGLTSFSGHAYISAANFLSWGAGSQFVYFVFIGTGFSKRSTDTSTDVFNNSTFAQNLPYGTHIVKVNMSASATWYSAITIDGISLGTQLSASYFGFKDITIHQPKMPPIPEEAVVLSDYMLMADFVKQSATGSDIYGHISKGTRLISSSRDHFYNSSAAFHAQSCRPRPADTIGLPVKNGSADATAKLPFFGTTGAFHVASSNQAWPCELGGSAATETKLDNTADALGDAITIAETVTLGNTSIQTTIPSGEYIFVSTQVATPIHTSHHYQTFESPFATDLVGGDRNMEQTNLIVTPDGKSWDEVTRDTSYIGSLVLTTQSSTNGWISNDNETTSTMTALNVQRGMVNAGYRLACFCKNDWALSYDRYICLVDGTYEINHHGLTAGGGAEAHRHIKINGLLYHFSHRPSTDSDIYDAFSETVIFNFKRGDYIQCFGKSHGDKYGHFQIRRSI